MVCGVKESAVHDFVVNSVDSKHAMHGKEICLPVLKYMYKKERNGSKHGAIELRHRIV